MGHRHSLPLPGSGIDTSVTQRPTLDGRDVLLVDLVHDVLVSIIAFVEVPPHDTQGAAAAITLRAVNRQCRLAVDTFLMEEAMSTSLLAEKTTDYKAWWVHHSQPPLVRHRQARGVLQCIFADEGNEARRGFLESDRNFHCLRLHRHDDFLRPIYEQLVSSFGTGLRIVLCWHASITDAFVNLVAQHCPLLQHLAFAVATRDLTDASIMMVSQRCPDLRHFALRCGESSITDTSIIAIAQHCPQLEHLDVGFTRGISDVSLIEVAKHCPHLQQLHVSFTGAVTHAAIIELAKHCRQLQQLYVRGTNTEITDAAINAIASSHPKLEIVRFW